MILENLKIGIKMGLDKIKEELITKSEPEIEAKMPEFNSRLDRAKEVYELQLLWDDVNEFLRQVGHDRNQNLRELQIEIEDRIEAKGGLRTKK